MGNSQDTCPTGAKYNPIMRHALVAALLLTSSLRAADAPEQLKILNVVALDANGQPVTDLTAADFHVLDDGKPQPILFFRFTGARATQTSLGPREYSNHSSAPRNPVVVLFDMLNDRILGDAYVRAELIDGLKKLESADNIYLYLLTPGGELVPVHGLPPADAVVQPSTEPWTRQIAPLLDQTMKPFAGFHPVDELDLKVRYEKTMAALNTLGGNVTEMSGRRSIVWVTHGFALFGYSLSVRGRLDFTDPLRNFFERLELSQVFLYPVDQSRRGAGADPTTYSAQTLDEAAALTGGRRLTSDRASEGIQSALTDARADYEIAYRMPSDKIDKKRRKLRVTATRKDIHIQSPQAYYVIARPPADVLLRGVIGTAVRSPFEATDIGIRATIAPAADHKSVVLNAYIDPADIFLHPSGDLQTGHLDFMIAAYDANGLDQASKPLSLDLKLTAPQLEAARRSGLAIRQTLAFKDSTERIRIIVYDPNLNSVGSVQVPLKAGE